jgi:hypothetical protein
MISMDDEFYEDQVAVAYVEKSGQIWILTTREKLRVHGPNVHCNSLATHELVSPPTPTASRLGCLEFLKCWVDARCLHLCLPEHLGFLPPQVLFVVSPQSSTACLAFSHLGSTLLMSSPSFR